MKSYINTVMGDIPVPITLRLPKHTHTFVNGVNLQLVFLLPLLSLWYFLPVLFVWCILYYLIIYSVFLAYSIYSSICLVIKYCLFCYSPFWICGYSRSSFSNNFIKINFLISISLTYHNRQTAYYIQ